MTCAACDERAPLCPSCRAQRWTWAVGMARDRGVAWAARVRAATATSSRPTWPAWPAPRVRARAVELVRDLAGGDEPLLLELSQACAEIAARAYVEPPPRPGGVAFTRGTGSGTG